LPPIYQQPTADAARSVRTEATWRYWATDEHGDYAVPSATELIEQNGLGEDFSLIPADRVAEKSTIGTQVHHLIANFLESSLLPQGVYEYHERVMDYWSCWWKWFHQHIKEHPDFRAIAIEEKFVLTGDRSGPIPPGGLAGTKDLFDWEDGAYGVTDWKCRRPKKHDGIQLAFYGILAAYNPKLPINIIQLPRIRRRCVYLREGGLAQVKVYNDPWDYSVANAALVVWHARNGNRHIRRKT
jgi:hypothetical protein